MATTTTPMPTMRMLVYEKTADAEEVPEYAQSPEIYGDDVPTSTPITMPDAINDETKETHISPSHLYPRN
ncbi:uncharacterized protein N7479_002292 [Penicillium vulpinum]|uniref:uncharacterized protein n=1 Tax=Penicillium vulpinum TaxID=29845 RepID=UPI002548725F|nr:uncharacterized protein N7479_002292 [Penicillium vulpinum]KAJ5972374.1 hypothetical protein N7479_002292 [Penicillium vulpinum]